MNPPLLHNKCCMNCAFYSVIPKQVTQGFCHNGPPLVELIGAAQAVNLRPTVNGVDVACERYRQRGELSIQEKAAELLEPVIMGLMKQYMAPPPNPYENGAGQ